MSRAQRLTFLGIAVAIAVVAVILIAGSGEDDTDTAQTGATPTATPTETSAPQEASPQETETPTPTPTPKPPLLDGSKVVKLEFKKDDTVRFRVVSDAAEEVHVHGYDIARDLEPGKEITMSFPASIEGIFEIEYEHAKQQIGELRVEPE